MKTLTLLRRLLIALLIAGSCTAAGFVRADLGWAATKAPDFCESQVIYDYEWPLKHLTSRHRIPSSGVLPFAPRDTIINRVGFNRVSGWKQPFGYRFLIARPAYRSGALKRPLRLNWTVRSTLRRVSRGGQPGRVLTSKRRDIGTVRYEKQLEFFVSAGPGIYRFDLSFEKLDGKRLGRYTEFFRVVPERVNARLVTNARTARLGEAIFSRVNNWGTTTFLVEGFFGQSGVERYDDGAWIEVLREPGPPLNITDTFIYGGYGGACLGFQVPSRAPPGLYRFARRINPFGPAKARRLFAEFTVQP